MSGMTTGLTSSVGDTVHLHGRARYRATEHGPVVVVPTRCASGRHVLTNVGYRIVETGQTLRVGCAACDQTGPDGSWSFITNGQQAVSAEFDDDPYAELVDSLVGHR